MAKPKYFSHDVGAKDSTKCMLLIEQLGLEGYGIFWVLIETLGEQNDYSYPLNLLSALARKYNTTLAKVETVVKEYGLFEIKNNKVFFSKSFNKRMDLFNEIIEQRRQAGIKSGESRRAKALENKQKLNKNEHMLNTCSTIDEQLNKTKLKQIEYKEEEKEKEENIPFFEEFYQWLEKPTTFKKGERWYRKTILNNLINEDFQTVENYNTFLTEKNQANSHHHTTEQIDNEINILKSIYLENTANELFKLNESMQYKKSFSKEVNQFIDDYGGLVKLKNIITDTNYTAWIFEEIEKNFLRTNQ